MRYGWLDATLFIHALFENDPHMPRCRRILRGLEASDAEGWLDPVTIHELTYALPRALPRRFQSRNDLVRYVLRFLALDTVKGDDKEGLIRALQIWGDRGIKFGNARLIAQAERTGVPVCSVNERDFTGVENTYDGEGKPRRL